MSRPAGPASSVRGVSLLIAGSIATDHLMTFEGLFADSLVVEQLDKISLSFLTQDLQVRRGGVAANIAFGMASLGQRPILVGAVGEDFTDYRSWLERHGVDCASVHYSESQHTARFHHLAETLAWMEREIHMARLLCWKAAWMLDLGLPNAKESSMSKAYAGSMVQKVTSKAIEVLGPEGVLANRLVEKLYRDQKVYDIFEGTGQIQRRIIAKNLTGLNAV